MKTYEKSCGAVIFKEANEQCFYLTVEYKSEPGYWGLVKGHVEPEETELETACREIYEEVGLQDLTFVDGFRTEIRYSPKPQVEKLVVFFLAKTHTDQVEYLWDEHTDHRWLDYEATISQLTYHGDQGVIRHAEAFLRSQH